jgi:hypothetical protein
MANVTDCASCEDFDLCHRCYTKTGGCSHKDHELLRYNAYDDRLVTVIGSLATCDVPGCKKNLKNDGAYYACKLCCAEEDAFHRICHSCYGAGAGCSDPKHSVTKMAGADKTNA